MEITKEISVKITQKELKQIVIDHLKKERGLTITDVHFIVGGHEDRSDWRGEFPLSYELDEVRCVGTEEKETIIH